MNGGIARPGWRSRFLSLGTAALAGSLVLAPGPAQADDTEFSIQVFCNDVSGAFPLAGVRVELWRRGLDELPKVITDTLVRVSTPPLTAAWGCG